MAGLSGGLNPNVVKTALDEVFNMEFQEQMTPDVATALDPQVFMQTSTDKGAIVTEVFEGVGEWSSTAEQANLAEYSPRVGDQQTHNVTKFAQAVRISEEYFADDEHDTVQSMIRDMARKGRITRTKNAFAAFRNGFTTQTTHDGSSLFNATHTTLSGDTVDNLDTAALTEASLETGIVALMEQLDQSGTVAGHKAACLLVPAALYKDAVEITDSELRSGTDNNDINFYSSRYGLTVKTSPYLGAAAGGSDTAWFLLSAMHGVKRYVREDLTTDLVDRIYQANNDYIYKAKFREVVATISWEGLYGSDGTV